MKVKDIVAGLEGAGILNAKQEALWLASHALGAGNAEILAKAEFSSDEARRIDALISRRISGEPLQYILGEADFCGRDFAVGTGVLIPRHDTETLIEGVKKVFRKDERFRFLDWGTGSGCIAITILLEFPKSEGCMIDTSPDALKYARENLRRYGVECRAEIEEAAGDFGLIVSNPPYIPSCEIPGLMREVRDFEPNSALDGGEDGMKFYREIFELAMTRLKRGGYMILETGNLRQLKEIEEYSEEFVSEGEIFDGGNFPRCVIMRRRI